MSPFAYYLSRLCEEFPGRLPSELMEEMDRLPCGLLDEIVAARAYGRAVDANKADPKGWQSSPLRATAMQIEHQLVEDALAAPDTEAPAT